MTKNDKELVRGFLLKSPPVIWVYIHGQLPSGKEKEALDAILFEPKGDCLRDLTQPGIPEEIFHCAQKNPKLLDLIWMEIDKTIDEIADILIETKPGTKCSKSKI